MLAKFVCLFDQLKKEKKKTMPNARNAREPGENASKKCEGSNGVEGEEVNKKKKTTKPMRENGKCESANAKEPFFSTFH